MNHFKKNRLNRNYRCTESNNEPENSVQKINYKPKMKFVHTNEIRGHFTIKKSVSIGMMDRCVKPLDG